jgi:hypothetical protein
MTHDSLKDLGIQVVGHRLRILKELEELKRANGIEVEAATSQAGILQSKIIAQGESH